MSIFGNDVNISKLLKPTSEIDMKSILNGLGVERQSKKYLLIPRDGIHISPLFISSMMQIPRYQAGEFYNFSSKHHDEVIIGKYINKLSNLKIMFDRIENKDDNNLFFLGDYETIKFYISEVSDEKGEAILGKGKSLNWLAMCPNPYLKEELSDEYPEYDLYRNYPNSRWLESPNGDNSLSVQNLKWIYELTTNKVTIKQAFGFYTGNGRLEPDYSRGRFFDDYIGIMITFLINKENGNGCFSLLWPVNDYALGIIGLIGILYQEVRYKKNVRTGPDDPNIFVYGFGKKNIEFSELNVLLNPNNFDDLMSILRKTYEKSFNDFFDKQKPLIDHRMGELKRRWLR